MSDSSANYEMAPPPKPVKRLGLGVRACLQIILVTLSIFLIFYLAITYHLRKDLTSQGTFTLSEATQKLIDSPDFQDRESPVRIIAAIRRSSTNFLRLQPILEEYQRISNQKIEIEYIDPIRDGNRSDEIRNNYDKLLGQKFFTEDILIIDARTPEKNENKHVKFLRIQDLLIWRENEKNQRKPIGYQDEDMITSFLKASVEGESRIMYLIADKSDLEVGAIGTPWQVLTETFIKQNVLLVPINISQIKAIPDNAEAVVIVSPQYDFEPAEMDVLNDYWNRPSSSIIAYLTPNPRLIRLKSFLRKHGVTPRDDRVIRTRNGKTDSHVLATFTGGLGISGALEMKSVPFEGRVGSLEVREGAEDLETNGIQAFTLIQSNPDFWGETSYRKPNPKFDSDSDNQGPLAIGAAVLKGNANDDSTADELSKMIVLSTTGFLDPKRLGNEQLDFVKNSTRWLLGRQELMGIGPRNFQMRKLNLIQDEVDYLQKITLFFIPLALVITALFVWNLRRS